LKNLDFSRRLARWGVVAVVLLPALPLYARAHKSADWAKSQFSTAERMREALNGRPTQERTRRQYQNVIDAYRRVYYGTPTSSKADASVVAVAELMVEMGRRFDDDKILNSAIAQYKFLRKEYPGSKYRFDALFTIGEIYKDDLDDKAKARATFQDFLKHYPHNHLADEAREALAEPAAPATKDSDESSRKSAKASENDDKAVADSSKGEDSDPVPARVTGIRHWSTPDYTRVAIDLEQDVKFDSQRIDNPDRIFFDLKDTKLASTLVGKTFDVDDGFLKKIRVAQYQPSKTRVVLEVDALSAYNAFLLSNPSRLIIDIHGKNSPQVSAKDVAIPPATAAKDEKQDDPTAAKEMKVSKTETTVAAKQVESKPPSNKPVKKVVDADADDEDDNDVTVVKLDPRVAKPEVKTTSAAKTRSVKDKRAPDPEIDVREARPTAAGDRSLIRALGLKIGKIVIDPGHGGHDTGTIGPNGLLEKDLVLDVGKRLGKQLERLGAEVVYTRTDDTFIPLETRTAIANQEQADLFVSIHANSSRDPDSRGVETYYLNFTSSRDALEVAARENAVSEKSIHELQDLVKKIALKEKIEESHEFASDVQQSLYGGLSARNPGIRDRGVKKAPFIVLIGANMPSILSEISFVSNPGDEKRLETPEYRQRIADSLYRGIAKYVNGLSGVKVASKIDKEQ